MLYVTYNLVAYTHPTKCFGGCPSGYNWENGNYCYRTTIDAGEAHKSFEEAKVYCKSDGGELASAHTAELQTIFAGRVLQLSAVSKLFRMG